MFLKTDVREWVQLERMFEVASSEFGGVDIVCPGAGIYDPHCTSTHSHRLTEVFLGDMRKGGRSRVREMLMMCVGYRVQFLASAWL